MGEIADDMVEGFACTWCGVYFEQSHGYPVVCTSCFDGWRQEKQIGWKRGKKRLLEQMGLQVAIEKELG